MSLFTYRPTPVSPNGTPGYSLTPREEEFLTRQNILLGVSVEGTRKVDAAILNTNFCTQVMEDLQPKWARDGLFHDFIRIVPVDASNQPPLVLPQSTLSIAALRCIGWNKESATTIFENWERNSTPRNNCEDRDPSLIKYVASHVYKRQDTFTEDGLLGIDPRAEMTTLRLSRRFQDEILEPEGNRTKNLKDLHYWIVDKMNKSYRDCVARLEFLKSYAVTGIRAEERISTNDRNLLRFQEGELFENAFMSGSGSFAAEVIYPDSDTHHIQGEFDFDTSPVPEESGPYSVWRGGRRPSSEIFELFAESPVEVTI
ncbi:hypothetical protein SBOR_6121 [Sclerotinia borealis F-4128]|uniref:Uncharacterized protein n=1 Tax=Sclerotinia borealis (strain F-4128) TaxID=1432307 RepID=W9C9P5_SCLBF|nr:hypothetical protein SBOR_6121 [Sclerotinia borealis F-4128]